MTADKFDLSKIEARLSNDAAWQSLTEMCARAIIDNAPPEARTKTLASVMSFLTDLQEGTKAMITEIKRLQTQVYSLSQTAASTSPTTTVTTEA